MKTLIVLLTVMLLIVSSALAAEKERVVVGIVDTNEPGWRAETLNPTIARLEKALPGRRIELLELSVYRTIDDVGRIRPDFIVAPSDVFLQLINVYGAQALAVRKTNRAADPVHSIGSTLIVPSTNTTIHSLADLRDKTVAASLPDSLGGWLALQGEIHRQGYDEKSFFREVHFLTFQIPDVITNVLSGKSDAGVLSACQLEKATASGLLDEGRLRVINEHHYDGLTCAHSSSLYPDLVFGALNFSQPTLLKDVSIALLTMPEEPTFSWQIAGKFDEVASLYATLQIGPWAPPEWTLKEFIHRFSREIALGILGIGLLLLNEVRLNWLVNRRTRDLKVTIAEKEAIASREAAMAKRINRMERNTIAAQMSSMIAHELKQPVAAIVNYIAVTKLRLEVLCVDDDQLDETAESIEREAFRISAIIDRVRSYVKRPDAHHAPCMLDGIVQKALMSLSHYSDLSPLVRVEHLASNAFIQGDELELEILLLNLLKNAAHAVSSRVDGMIWVSVTLVNGNYRLCVADNGPKLDDEAFARLTQASDSTSGGLGLGLGIIRSIADAHSATIVIERLPAGGIQVLVDFEALEGDR